MSNMTKIKRHNYLRDNEEKKASAGANQSTNLDVSYSRDKHEKSSRLGKPHLTKSDSRPDYWIYGYHSVTAAIRNPERKKFKLVATNLRAKKLQTDLPNVSPEILDRKEIGKLLPYAAIHQGIALLVQPLKPQTLEHIIKGALAQAVVLVLDQVTDPHNIGSVLRNGAAFGANAVVLTTRNSTSGESTLAKAASGALEIIPLVRSTNLARALDQLKGANFWRIGLADNASERLDSAPLTSRVALILGAEGRGLRRLTRKNCDMLVSLPTQSPIKSINVSSASATALYEISRQRSVE